MKDLNGLLKESDYVICVLPGTGETRHILGKAQFSAMKKTARFISMGRGSVVDEAALADALKSGRIAGAALDVFEKAMS